MKNGCWPVRSPTRSMKGWRPGRLEPFTPKAYWRDRSFLEIGEKLLGFPAEKLEVSAVRDCQELRELPDGRLDFDKPGRYVIYELPHNASGFLEIKLACFSPLTLYVSFDELLMERAADDRASRVDCTRLDCANAVRYDLGVGRHSLRFF